MSNLYTPTKQDIVFPWVLNQLETSMFLSTRGTYISFEGNEVLGGPEMDQKHFNSDQFLTYSCKSLGQEEPNAQKKIVSTNPPKQRILKK